PPAPPPAKPGATDEETKAQTDAYRKKLAEHNAYVSKPEFQKRMAKVIAAEERPVGKMRSWPWSEERGDNPYLLATGQTKSWQGGGFWDWLLRRQLPVLLEPLFKLIQPIVLFFRPEAGPLISFYALLVLVWTVVTW